MDAPDLHELWIALNRPSAERFAVALRKRGIKVRTSDIKEILTKHVGTKQIFAPPPKLRGHITAPGKDVRWMSDIIVNTHSPVPIPGTDRTYKAILVAQDVYTRYAFAEPMETQSDVVEAMEAIFKRASEQNHNIPNQLITDRDGVFQSPEFRDLMERNDVIHTYKESQNDIGTVDRLIFTIRRALAEEQSETGEGNWSLYLQKVVRGYNEAPHSALLNGSPEEASRNENKELAFELERRTALDMVDNQKDIQRRKAKLQAAGAFRVLERAPRMGRRVFRNVWSERIHMLRGFDETDSRARDEEGTLFPTKELLPVHPESSRTRLVEADARPLNSRVRDLLRRYADKITVFLSRAPERTASLQRIAAMLDREAAQWREATRLARLNQKRPVAALVEHFPDLFWIKGSSVTLS